jgi:hypothetical protein
MVLIDYYYENSSMANQYYLMVKVELQKLSLFKNTLVLNMNFSSRTNSLDVQKSIEDSVEKRTKVFLKVPINV